MPRIHLPLAAAVTALTGAILLPSGAVAYTQASDRGTLAFATGGDGASDKLEIGAIDADGRRFHRLTHVPTSGFAPRWSTDGRRILFVTEDTFSPGTANWSMRADGSGQRRLPGGAWDVPSPSGRLVFGYDRIVTVDGKIVRRLRPGLHRDEYYTGPPLWSPDGRYVAINVARQRQNSDAYDDTWIALVPTTPGGRGRALTPRKTGRFAEALSWSPDSRRLLAAIARGRTYDWYTLAPDGSDRRLVVHTRRSGLANHAWSRDGRRIAYIGGRGGLFVVDANGGSPRRIASTRSRGPHAWSVYLDWSSRGEIAVSEKGGTYIVRADGSGRRHLSARTGDPTSYWNSTVVKWSPDGQRLVLSDRKAIYVINRRGDERQLTHWLSDGEPQVSPDGRRITFVRGRGVYLERPVVYVMNIDGTRQHRLGAGRSPLWSPDGSRVAYIQDRRIPHNDRIVVADANGRGPRSVINGGAPTWSPDGRLAFMRYDYVHEDRGDHGGAQWYLVRSTLQTARADGGGESEIATFDADSEYGPITASAPAWSPNGRSIALVVGGSVQLVDAINGMRRSVQALQGESPRLLEWSADGSRLLATSYNTIGVIDGDTGATTRVLELSDDEIHDATWSPDGTTIGFIRCTSDEDVCDVYSVAPNADTHPRRLTRTQGVELGLDWSS